MKRLIPTLIGLLLAIPLFGLAAQPIFNITQGGTGRAGFPGGALLVGNSTAGLLATSSPTVGSITATSSATSTFAGPVTLATTTSSSINGVITVDGFIFPRSQLGIQLAINLCSALALINSCGEVYLPAGLYNTTSTITMKSNVSLRGAGMGSTIIKGAPTTYTMINTVRSGTSKSLYSNIGIRDLTLVSQSDAIVELNNASNVNISGVEVYYTVSTPISEPLNIQYSQFVSVINSYLHDLTGNGIQLNAVDHFVVANNRVNGVQVVDKDCIDIDTDFLLTKAIPSRYGTVIGNDVTNCVNGIRVENGSNVLVSGNTINGATDSGIYVNTSDGLSLANITVASNNISSTTLSGITVVSGGTGETTEGILVQGNSIADAGKVGGSNVRAGILIAAASTSASNNFITNSGGNDANGGAVVVYKVSNVSVVNNTIASSSIGVNFWNGSGAVTYSNVQARDNSFSAVAVRYRNDNGVLSQPGILISGPQFSAFGTALYGIGTSTPGSAFSVGGIANLTTATTTFYGTGGLNVVSGCYAIGGVCLGGTSLTGSTGQVGYFSGTNTAIGTSSLTIGTDQSVSINSSNTGLVGSLFNISDASTIGGNQTLNINSARGGGVQAVRIGMSGGGNALLLAQSGNGTALNISASSTATGLVLNSNGTLFPTYLMDLQKSGTTKFNVGSNGDSYLAGNFGMGTTSPWGQLSINPNGIVGPSFAIGSSTATRFLVTNGGLVGIGMANPTVALDINGMLHTSAIGSVAAGSAGIRLYSYANDTQMGMGRPNSAQYAEFIFDTNGTRDWTLGTRSSDSGLYFYDQTTLKSSLYLKPGGNVGVGTTSPATLLDLFSTASTTMRIDNNVTNKGGQIIIKDAAGGTYTCIYTQSGSVLSKPAASATSC